MKHALNSLLEIPEEEEAPSSELAAEQWAKQLSLFSDTLFDFNPDFTNNPCKRQASNNLQEFDNLLPWLISNNDQSHDKQINRSPGCHLQQPLINSCPKNIMITPQSSPVNNAILPKSTVEKSFPDPSNSHEQDKRRRNTAASARFRQRKKQREEALEKLNCQLNEQCSTLNKRVVELEIEIGWLRGLLIDRDGAERATHHAKMAALAAAAGIQSPVSTNNRSNAQ